MFSFSARVFCGQKFFSIFLHAVLFQRSVIVFYGQLGIETGCMVSKLFCLLCVWGVGWVCDCLVFGGTLSCAPCRTIIWDRGNVAAQL